LWTWSYQGNPWGEQAPSSNGYSYNLRFPGQYYDAETGLSYNINRDYDAATGRYVQSDPIGLEGGPSTYSYANQSPLVYFDFYGTQAYAQGPMYHGISTIICDGLGDIVIHLIQENPCWDDCTREHEEVHREDSLRSNPSVCLNQPAGTQVWVGQKAEDYRSEVRAYDKELDCLRRKLAAITWCDKCAKAIEDRIDHEEGMRARYDNWLQKHPGQ